MLTLLPVIMHRKVRLVFTVQIVFGGIGYATDAQVSGPGTRLAAWPGTRRREAVRAARCVVQYVPYHERRRMMRSLLRRPTRCPAAATARRRPVTFSVLLNLCCEARFHRRRHSCTVHCHHIYIYSLLTFAPYSS